MPFRRSRQIYATEKPESGDVDHSASGSGYRHLNDFTSFRQQFRETGDALGTARTTDDRIYPQRNDPGENHQSVQCDREYQRRINNAVAVQRSFRDRVRNRSMGTAATQQADRTGKVPEQATGIHKVVQQVSGIHKVARQAGGISKVTQQAGVIQTVAHKADAESSAKKLADNLGTIKDKEGVSSKVVPQNVTYGKHRKPGLGKVGQHISGTVKARNKTGR